MNVTSPAPLPQRAAGVPALSTTLFSRPQPKASMLAWPAWGRALAVTPALGLLWLAVAWAMAKVAPL